MSSLARGLIYVVFVALVAFSAFVAGDDMRGPRKAESRRVWFYAACAAFGALFALLQGCASYYAQQRAAEEVECVWHCIDDHRSQPDCWVNERISHCQGGTSCWSDSKGRHLTLDGWLERTRKENGRVVE